jgi:hypothetical protein
MGMQESLRRNEMARVKNISLKLLIVCFMVGFGLFFGMDIANKRLSNSTATSTHSVSPGPTASPAKGKVGQEASTGPMTAATARRQSQAAQLKEQAQAAAQAEQPLIVLQDSFVNRLSNAIGNFFRHLASFLLHAVVAFFKLILG